nr:MAG TPA: hypothetical protein [Bacteriophage sp.]
MAYVQNAIIGSWQGARGSRGCKSRANRGERRDDR